MKERSAKIRKLQMHHHHLLKLDELGASDFYEISDFNTIYEYPPTVEGFVGIWSKRSYSMY